MCVHHFDRCYSLVAHVYYWLLYLLTTTCHSFYFLALSLTSASPFRLLSGRGTEDVFFFSLYFKGLYFKCSALNLLSRVNIDRKRGDGEWQRSVETHIRRQSLCGCMRGHRFGGWQQYDTIFTPTLKVYYQRCILLAVRVYSLLRFGLDLSIASKVNTTEMWRWGEWGRSYSPSASRCVSVPYGAG